MAKRGTEGWQIIAEPVSGRFEISLARSGLVDAVKEGRGQRRNVRVVRPGEYVNQDNIANMWIDQEIFDRNVQFCAVAGMTLCEQDIANENTMGLSVLSPGAGSAVLGLSGRVNAGWTMAQIEANFPTAAGAQPERFRPEGALPPTTLLLPIQRPEGNFGTPESYTPSAKYQVLVPRRR